MSFAGEGVGKKGERIGQGGRPGATDEGEGNEKYVGVVDEIGGDETYGTKDKTDGIAQFRVLDLGNDHCPEYAAHGLYGIEDAHPVACFLIGGGGYIEFTVDNGCGEGIGSDSTVGIGPHKEEGCPAEELYDADGPECRRGLGKELQHGRLLFFFFHRLVGILVILRIGAGFPFANLDGGVEHTEDEDEGSDVEGVDDGVGYNTLFGSVTDANPCKEVREHEAYDASGVAEEGLYGIGQFLLPLIYHVSYEHLEGLHGHIDGSVEEHEHEESEEHRCRHGSPYFCGVVEMQTSGIREQAHYGHRYGSSEEEIGYAASPTGPCAVAVFSDKGLHNHSHKRGKNPEEGKGVGVGTEGGEDARDVRTLQGVGNLYAEESETEVPKPPEFHVRFLFHFRLNVIECRQDVVGHPAVFFTFLLVFMESCTS